MILATNATFEPSTAVLAGNLKYCLSKGTRSFTLTLQGKERKPGIRLIFSWFVKTEGKERRKEKGNSHIPARCRAWNLRLNLWTPKPQSLLTGCPLQVTKCIHAPRISVPYGFQITCPILTSVLLKINSS